MQRVREHPQSKAVGSSPLLSHNQAEEIASVLTSQNRLCFRKFPVGESIRRSTCIAKFANISSDELSLMQTCNKSLAKFKPKRLIRVRNQFQTTLVDCDS